MVTTTIRPSNIHVANDAANAPSGDQDPEALLPYLLELVQELLVVVDVTELAWVPWGVILEVGVGGRGDHQVHGAIRQLGHLPAITKDYPMRCRSLGQLFAGV